MNIWILKPLVTKRRKRHFKRQLGKDYLDGWCNFVCLCACVDVQHLWDKALSWRRFCVSVHEVGVAVIWEVSVPVRAVKTSGPLGKHGTVQYLWVWVKISLKTHQKELSSLYVVPCAVSDVKGALKTAVYLKILSWGGCSVSFIVCLLQALQPHQLGQMVAKEETVWLILCKALLWWGWCTKIS